VREVENVRKAREAKLIDEEHVELSEEFAALFQNYTSVSNDNSRSRMRLTKKKEYESCVLCLAEMRGATKFFNC